MKTSIIFSEFGTIVGHKVSNSWNLLTPRYSFYTAKILADASIERVKTYKSYTRRRRSIVSSRDSTAGGLFITAEEILSTDERNRLQKLK
ncbi:hypothetical protein Tco_0669669 [Tanacetum coccineum]